MRHETALKIIGLLRKEFQRGLTILDISKKLHIGYRPAYNHILKLEQVGIITIKTVGRAKQCFLNLESAQCRHFLQEVDLLRKESLYQHQVKLKTVLESLILKITGQYTADIHSIILFGSYAKSTATSKSDIDLIFVVSNLKDKVVREGIERESNSYYYSHYLKISPLITDITELKKMLRAKEMNVGKEAREYGISLYGSESWWRFITWPE